MALAVAPRLRGLVGRDRRAGAVLRRRARRAGVRGLARGARRSAASGPPRRTTRSSPSACRASRRCENPADPESVRAGVDEGGRSASWPTTPPTSRPTTRAGARLTDPFPRVVVVAGLGLFATGKDRRTAGIVDDIYHHTISVLGAATLVRQLCLAHRAGRLRRRVLAARALQALAGPAREGAGPAHRAGHGRRQRHRPRGGPAAGRRGRPRGGDRPGRGGRAQGRPRRSWAPWARAGRWGSGWT